jgi:hypothetical protein
MRRIVRNMESYPNYRNGTRVGVKAGLVTALIITIPNLLVPVGDPIEGADFKELIKEQWTWFYFWEEKAFVFGVFFVLAFAVGFVIGTFRPELNNKA